MRNRIVVGISGKPSGESALRWALDFADARHSDVELVHVVDDRWAALATSSTGTALLDAEHGLRSRAERSAEQYPALHIHPTVLEGAPIDSLVGSAIGADLLVVGSHELGRFQGLVFSTRAANAAALSTVDVAIVPNEHEFSGSGVVVGIDGSASSVAALEFGAAEADRLRQPLTAVFAWQAPAPWSTPDAQYSPRDLADGDRLVMSEAVAGLADRYPDLRVEQVFSRALPTDALMRASVGARLLVIGTHGRNSVAKAWLGSVSHELVLAMPCTVVVIQPKVR